MQPSKTGGGVMSGITLGTTDPYASPKKMKILVAAGILLVAVSLGVGLGVGLTAGSSSSSGGERPTVEMAFIASGDVSDFTDTVQDELKEKVGGEVGAKPSDVELTITAASVLLSFRITVANEAALMSDAM